MKLKGYIFSRSFFGERVPQHIQNLVLRDYCKKNNYKFLLSGTEYKLEKSTFILNEILSNYSQYDGIIFYSIFQLPEEKKERENFYNFILKKKKSAHFVLENLKIETFEDLIFVEKIIKIKIAYKKSVISNLGNYKNFVTPNHKRTKRNYLERMMDNKIHCMKISKKYSQEYWDGDRKYGYGGYKYIKDYNKQLAEKLIETYKLTNQSRVLDLGCGKGFLMYELKKILNKLSIIGVDMSIYAKKNAKKEIKHLIKIQNLNQNLNFKENYFDLVLSINTLHNLKLSNLSRCIKEIELIGKQKFICVESFRNEEEQFNLQCWALTAETLVDTSSWQWIFQNAGYTGDYEFIFFE